MEWNISNNFPVCSRWRQMVYSDRGNLGTRSSRKVSDTLRQVTPMLFKFLLPSYSLILLLLMWIISSLKNKISSKSSSQFQVIYNRSAPRTSPDPVPFMSDCWDTNGTVTVKQNSLYLEEFVCPHLWCLQEIRRDQITLCLYGNHETS